MLSKDKLYKELKHIPIFESEILQNLGLFIPRQNMSRILAMNELYKKIINIHGIICEFGVRWGTKYGIIYYF